MPSTFKALVLQPLEAFFVPRITNGLKYPVHLFMSALFLFMVALNLTLNIMQQPVDFTSSTLQDSGEENRMIDPSCWVCITNQYDLGEISGNCSVKVIYSLYNLSVS